MSVNWNCSTCPAYIEADKHDEDSKEWREFVNLRESLIWGLLITGYPVKSEWAITDDNWREIFTRLNMVERVSGAYRSYHREKSEGGVKYVFFTPAEVKSMIGLRVNAGNKSNREFSNWIEKRLREEAGRKITRFEESDND